MTEATLSLGGNVGDVVAAFRFALDRLAQTEGIALLRVSSVYRTQPWGKTDQPDFLNMAVMVRTTLSAHALLAACIEAERARGRVRAERWGPRSLDIDLLTFGDVVMATPDLTVPHPRLRARAFVLVPLAEIAADLRIDAVPVADLLADVDAAGVTLDEVATRRLRDR